MTNRTRFRARARAGGGGVSYDADAQAYIAATGELFPEALNTLVLGIKAAGLWDDHIGSIKKAIGVPSLAASMIDLRNTAFNGTAFNAPTHSAMSGWTFLQASSQYIADPWGPGVANSKATLNSTHMGRRIKHALAAGGSAGRSPGYANAASNVNLGFVYYEPSFVSPSANDGGSWSILDATFLGHAIISRTASNARAYYLDGAVKSSDTQVSTAMPPPVPIGARNDGGSVGAFFTGRITIQHGGAGLDATQAAALTALFDAYAIAAGET